MELSQFMVFWAHFDGFFAKFSFTTVLLLSVVMAMLYLSDPNYFRDEMRAEI
jgi:hypothetical protein